mmetsp:Transcript_26623/g.75155  ORF Transcript_26623/g.75155 Transcript_26623/m.75155 type:complete len:231 (-) Transcript_26623:61-753(-)
MHGLRFLPPQTRTHLTRTHCGNILPAPTSLGLLPCKLAVGVHEREEVFMGLLQALVHDHAVPEARLPHVRHLRLRAREPLLDLLLGLGAAAPQPGLEHLERGRGDEEVPRLGVERAPLHALGALHIDVEEADLPVLHDLLDGAERGAVVVPVHLRGLEEEPLGHLALEHRALDEVVVLPAHLPGPGAPRGVRDGEAEAIWEVPHQLFEQRGLPRPAGATQDNEAGRHRAW